jgi:AcrR family transcriptional regulator
VNALRPKTKHDVVCDFRRGAILDAARRIFARKGFAAALVDDIAEEAGIAKGTVYLYFRSKDEIYIAALVQGVEALRAITAERVRAAGDLRSKLRAFAAVRLEYFGANQEFFRIYISEFGSQLTRSKPFPKELMETYRQQHRLLQSALESGIRKKEIRRVPVEMAASAIYDLTRAVIERRLLGWSKTSPDEDLEFLMEFVWRGLQRSKSTRAV